MSHFLHLNNVITILASYVCICVIYYLLHGLGRLLFRLHMNSTFGLFALNVKVKLFSTIVDGLHTGQLICRTEHAVKIFTIIS